MRKTDRTAFAAAHRQGMTRDELAQHFGITPVAVTRIRRELGLPLEAPKPPRHRPAKIDRDTVKALVGEGHTNVEIAERLGVHPDSISRVRVELGIAHEYRGQPMTPERLKIIEDRIADGWSHAEIIRTEGIDHATITKYFPGTAWTKQQTTEHVRALRSLDGGHFNRRPRTYDETKYRAAA